MLFICDFFSFGGFGRGSFWKWCRMRCLCLCVCVWGDLYMHVPRRMILIEWVCLRMRRPNVLAASCIIYSLLNSYHLVWPFSMPNRQIYEIIQVLRFVYDVRKPSIWSIHQKYHTLSHCDNRYQLRRAVMISTFFYQVFSKHSTNLIREGTCRNLYGDKYAKLYTHNQFLNFRYLEHVSKWSDFLLHFK